MVSHDCVAFYLLSEEVSKSIKVVQSGQGADEILAGYDWYPPLADVAREQTIEAYPKVFFDRAHAEVGDLGTRDVARRRRSERGSSSRPTSRAPGAPTALDAALRLDTQVMLVDDPVKRVDNMTMAWGLEARVPFLDHELVELAADLPGRAQAGRRRQGRAQGRAAGASPRRGHRPYQGLLPGARHPPPARAVPGHGPRRADQRAARARGLYRSAAVERCWPHRTRHGPRLGANALWQLAVLEMWLQSMER